MLYKSFSYQNCNSNVVISNFGWNYSKNVKKTHKNTVLGYKKGSKSRSDSGKNPRPQHCIGTYLLLFHESGRNIPVGGGKTLIDLPPS